MIDGYRPDDYEKYDGDRLLCRQCGCRTVDDVLAGQLVVRCTICDWWVQLIVPGGSLADPRQSEPDERLAGEAQITWAAGEHPELYRRYLRESDVLLPFRRRRPAAWRVPGRLVAWAELEDSAPAESPGRFRRRVWWLADRDLDPAGAYAAGGAPAEGVHPSWIRRGYESRPPRPA